ncbi:MAG: hypothetical protein JXA21_07690 [Anaerolineae bacterium]|nr:hypothetical protein [Anaerolineae bacterium]
MMAFVKVLVALALIFGATAGTVSASQESLPGSVLYPVKVGYEDVRLSLTQDSEAKALLAMTYAQERVDEAVELAERGDEVPEPLAARYQLQVGVALQTMEGLGEAQQLQLRAHFSGTLQNQVRVMEQAMARWHQGENPEHPEPTQAMIQTMQQTMAQMQQEVQQQFDGFGPQAGDEAPNNDEAPGPNPDNGNAGENGQCVGDCDGHNGESQDHEKHHKNGGDKGGVSDKGQNQNTGDKGGSTDNGGDGGNADNGGDGGGNDNGGADPGGNGGGGDAGNGNGGGNGGSGNGTGGGSGSGGGN